MIINDITDAIGDTPLLRLPKSVTKLSNIELYAKLEFFNPFGSIKDRIAWGMLKDELPKIVHAGQGIIENSSGNTAKAIAVLAARLRIPFKLVSAMVKVRETKDILKLLGVELEEISGAVNCFDPTDPNDPQYLIAKEVDQSNGKLFFTSQFTNEKNPDTHYESTAQEILRDLGSVDYLCSGLGTSGSTLGTARRLKEVNSKTKIIGIVAGKSDFIPGIRNLDQLMGAGIFQPEFYDEIITIESNVAIDGMLSLIRECGVLGGPTGGAHFAGALSYLRAIDPQLAKPAVAVTIVCDRMEWYLSYLRERRPELFGEKRKAYSMYTLSGDAIVRAPSVSFREADEWVQKSGALVVDIRAAAAFEFGSFPGAINLPGDHLEKILDAKVPFVNSETPVLFVCPIGDQSRRFAAQLTRLGGRGFSLEGGLMAWRNFRKVNEGESAEL